MTLVFLCGTALILTPLNPFGLAQRLFFGMQPPYRWVDVTGTGHGADWRQYQYVGANGRVCAFAYTAYLDETDNTWYPPRTTPSWQVFGYGFDADHVTEQEARAVAERECR